MLRDEEEFQQVTIESFTAMAAENESPFRVELVHRRLQMFDKDCVYCQQERDEEAQDSDEDPEYDPDEEALETEQAELDKILAIIRKIRGDRKRAAWAKAQELPQDESKAETCKSESEEVADEAEEEHMEEDDVSEAGSREASDERLEGDMEEDFEEASEEGSEISSHQQSLKALQKLEREGPMYPETVFNDDQWFLDLDIGEELLNSNTKLNKKSYAVMNAFARSLEPHKEFDGRLLLARTLEGYPDKFLILTETSALLSNHRRSVVVHLPADARYSNRVFRQLLVWGKHYILVPSQGPWLFYDENLLPVENKTVVIGDARPRQQIHQVLTTSEHIYVSYLADLGYTGSRLKLGRLDREFQFSPVPVEPSQRFGTFQVKRGLADLAFITTTDYEKNYLIHKGGKSHCLKCSGSDHFTQLDFKMTYTDNYALVYSLDSEAEFTPWLTLIDGKSLFPKFGTKLDPIYEGISRVRLLAPFQKIFPLTVANFSTTSEYYRMYFFCEYKGRVYRLGEQTMQEWGSRDVPIHVSESLWLEQASVSGPCTIITLNRFLKKWILC